MKIKFLGTGGAIDWKKGNSAAIVKMKSSTILIDAGPSVFPSLEKAGALDSINGLLLTHLHGDHTGGLFQLIVYYYHILGKKLIIITPDEKMNQQVSQFVSYMKYEHAINFQSIENYPQIGHIDTYGQHVEDMQTYAYYFTENQSLIYYSGDLGTIGTTKKFLASRSEKDILVFHDINKKQGRSHTYYKDAMEHLADYNVFGYHCAKETMPEDNTIPLVEDCPKFKY